jgi:hypothetical protein
MLAAVLDIKSWLEEDRHTPFAERLHRDRKIGRTLNGRSAVEQVLGWWHQVVPTSAQMSVANAPGTKVEHACTVSGAVLLLLGFVGGVAISGAAFAYQGQYPVNLFTLLGVLVGLPLLFLFATLLMLLWPFRGAGGLRSALAGLNLGRWVGSWLDRALQVDLFATFQPSGAQSGFARWQLLVFSQWLAIGFFLGALVLGFLLVAFTDLAFGWSTTLDLTAERVFGWVRVVAMPWAAWLPSATPDLALVETSRYFRLEQGGMPLSRASVLGTWWPFILATVAFYGLLPRLLLMAVGYWRLRHAVRRMLLDDSEVTALLDRLNSPMVSLEGSAEEGELETPVAPLPAMPAAHDYAGGAADGDVVIVVWNGAVSEETALAWAHRVLGASARASLSLSVLQDEAEQRSLLESCRASASRILLFTKGWEPPLLEFMDFLGLLREHFGSDCSLTILPLNLQKTGVDPDDRQVWSQALGRLRDPRLYVMEAVS